MKNKIRYAFMTFVSVVCLAGALSSCSDELSEKTLPYLFRPVNFAVTLNSVNATLSWAAVDSAKSYTVQISQDSLAFKNIISTYTTTNLNYTLELAGNTRYSARVRANASDTTKDSKYNATLTFKTPTENIFNGYGTSENTNTVYSAYMTALNTLDIKWLPGASVTHLILTNSSGVRDSVLISSTEGTNGEKIISGLSNSTYTVQIYNNTYLRGTTTGIVEGDVLLNSGDNIATAIANATAGQVILLAAGATFTTGSAAISFNQNIKLRGLSASNRPVVCMTSGVPTSTANMLAFTAGSTINSVQFENIDFNGYCSNNTAATEIGYLFNSGVLCNVNALTFTNCILRNFGNTPMRMQKGTGQVISTLSFNGCTIYNIGFSSTYAIVNINNSADYINNISFANCTIYDFKGAFILRTATSVTVTMSSISISNCTFNQSTQDTGTSRCFIDLNGVTGVTNGVIIQNCILGSNGTIAAGIRSATSPTITGTYYTSDYNDNSAAVVSASLGAYSIMAKMTAYSGTSTALWTAPLTGNFTLLTSSFAGKGVAGDLRWY
jgi:hypothetical protein